jgi:iron complex transport system substrate-binding protein
MPDHPHRLVCLIPNVTDTVYALGAGGDVVGVSDYTKYPAEARLKPSVGLPLSPSLETILSLHPDLVLGSGDLNLVQSVEQLERYGIPIFMVKPRGIEGIYSSIVSLGKALDRESAASRLVADLRAREQAVRQRVHGKPEIRVFMPVWYDPIITIGKNAFITELISIAGGKSVTDDISQDWPQVSLEAIIARSPEAILLNRDSKISVKDLGMRPGWDRLPAIRDHRVYYVSDDIELPSPIVFDALEDLAKQFHP